MAAITFAFIFLFSYLLNEREGVAPTRLLEYFMTDLLWDQ
jgi:hypothetical protein